MDNVLVTGGTRGLGLGIAKRLASEGWRVIAAARNQSDAVRHAAGAAADAGAGAIEYRTLDLSDTAAIPGFVKALRKEFGPIAGLVNNAGLGTSGVLATMRDADIERLIHLNTVAPVLLTKYVVRAMMADGGGKIVNISSIISYTGYSGLSVYAATKASIAGFTRSLAREVGPLGIAVNAVAPGFIETDMTGDLDTEDRARIMRRSALRRLADVDDVANAVAYLLHKNTKNVTGTLMTVDAGNTA